MIILDPELRPALEAIVTEALRPEHPQHSDRTPVQRVADALLSAESPLHGPTPPEARTTVQRGEQARLVGDYFGRLALETTDAALRGNLLARCEEQHALATAMDVVAPLRTLPPTPLYLVASEKR